MQDIPDHVKPYKRTKDFTRDTIPAALMKDHQTKAGTWGVIHVESGTLEYCIGEKETHILTAESPPGIVAPEEPHRVRPIGEVSFFVAFHK